MEEKSDDARIEVKADGSSANCMTGNGRKRNGKNV